MIRGVVGVGAVIREDAVPALNVSWDQHMMIIMNYPPWREERFEQLSIIVNVERTGLRYVAS